MINNTQNNRINSENLIHPVRSFEEILGVACMGIMAVGTEQAGL
jgi:hypothetical protein